MLILPYLTLHLLFSILRLVRFAYSFTIEKAVQLAAQEEQEIFIGIFGGGEESFYRSLGELKWIRELSRGTSEYLKSFDYLKFQ